MIWISLLSLFVTIVLLVMLLPRWVWALVRQQKMFFEHSSEQFFASRFLFIQGKAFVKVVLLILMGCGVVVGLVTRSVLLVSLLFIFFILSWPVVIHYLRGKRVKQIEKQFPDFLFALASALKAGSSLALALHRISALTPAPLQQELALVLKEQRMGLSLTESIERLQHRLSCESTLLFSSAVAVAGHSGGAIADLLEQIARTIQNRIHVEQRIHTLTAQGRMQAWVMLSVPFFIAFALFVIDPSLISPLWQQAGGKWLLILIFMLELIGYWMIRRIVAISI